MQKKIIIGNWKENPSDLQTAKKLLQISSSFPKLNILHAVPTIFAGILIEENKNIILQNISSFESGSHTGEISSKQAKSLGFPGSIIGHSETRLSPQNPHGDEDKEVNQKLKNIFAESMSAILCVGEYVRDENYKSLIENQIKKDLVDLAAENISNIIFAYEPVWAIGKDATRAATEAEIVETITFIKSLFPNKQVKVLYGGSVDDKNAKEILRLDVVDGLLVGRASSDPEKWESLLKSISSIEY